MRQHSLQQTSGGEIISDALFLNKSLENETSKNQVQIWNGAGKGLPTFEVKLGLLIFISYKQI